MDDKTKVVETLLDKASKQEDGGQAQHFAQAACNAANALRVRAEMREIEQRLE